MTIKGNFIIIILIALQTAVLAAEQGLNLVNGIGYCTGLKREKKEKKYNTMLALTRCEMTIIISISVNSIIEFFRSE